MVAGVSIYECPVILNDLPKNTNSSHYVIEQDYKMEIQHMIVLPYSIDTYADSTKSRIYKVMENRWQLIHEVATIHPESQDKLLERLQKLLIFS